ncbi:uncharacterized protein LOC134701851 [Mytilus trossulus]|uniref:uncharacterized protein LOC134701851 n=1 Tax=Mytilus trossulus TaxID=6551 RepID=UPI0030074C7F
MQLFNYCFQMLRWTTKIKDVLGPDYTFIDDCITDSVTLEDILSHRTGLGSADLLLQAGIPEYVTREQMMKNLHYLPKLQEFRDSFFYNNIVYILAAHVAEKRANKTWEQLMKEELLVPLNMTSTVILDERHSETLAVPYIVDKTGKLYKSDDRLYSLHPFGPSGSICASADDMTKWLKLITSKGKIADGAERIISEYVFKGQFNIKSVLSSMWANAYSLTHPQFPVAFDSLGYGYGCWLNETTACSYPAPWRNYRSKRSSQDVMSVSGKDLEEFDMHTGVYSHPLYGSVTITRINNTLHISYG